LLSASSPMAFCTSRIAALDPTRSPSVAADAIVAVGRAASGAGSMRDSRVCSPSRPIGLASPRSCCRWLALPSAPLLAALRASPGCAEAPPCRPCPAFAGRAGLHPPGAAIAKPRPPRHPPPDGQIGARAWLDAQGADRCQIIPQRVRHRSRRYRGRSSLLAGEGSRSAGRGETDCPSGDSNCFRS
jgi:hypothetical protein